MSEVEALDLPLGFRFHPTDEEIILHYLTRKALNPRFVSLVIGEVDLYKCEPWDLPARAKMGETEWYFFCHKDKYPTGMRTNRATESGYWKATGKDREIRGRGVLVGMKKTLVFHHGHAPHGERTSWVMHEFRLEGKQLPRSAKDEWAVCKVFNKELAAWTEQPMAATAAGAELERVGSLGFLNELLDSAAMELPAIRRNDEINTELEVLYRVIKGSEEPTNLKLLLLQHITNRFSDERRIGHGGCGVVYKGILPGEVTIAVKRISNLHTVDDKMFRREVESMMMVKHQNIVRFLGYCSQTEEQASTVSGNFIMAEIRERLLCFEYISNGSLDHHVSDELRGLEWHTRYQIIKGICEGLYHLHKYIIHMDLKPANILLDDHMTPKITDFGLSRLLDDKSHTMDANRLFTRGYCAPEYLDSGKMSAKSDMYSLGVIILELVTGTKNPNFTKVHRRWRHRWNKSAKDIQQGYKQVAKCLGWAQKCTNMNPICRPNVSDILSDLNKIDGSDVDINDDATGCLDMLGIEPLEIHLPCELNKQISCCIELTNETDDYFAFMISTTSLCTYSIHPKSGTSPPQSKVSVTITLLKTPEKALLHHHCRDEFTVQSTRVDGSLAAMDISGDMFNEVPDEVVDEVNFMVVRQFITS